MTEDGEVCGGNSMEGPLIRVGSVDLIEAAPAFGNGIAITTMCETA